MPTSNKYPDRFKAWTLALQPYASGMIPNKNVCVCNRHFVSGKPSKDRRNLDFKPNKMMIPAFPDDGTSNSNLPSGFAAFGSNSNFGGFSAVSTNQTNLGGITTSRTTVPGKKRKACEDEIGDSAVPSTKQSRTVLVFQPMCPTVLEIDLSEEHPNAWIQETLEQGFRKPEIVDSVSGVPGMPEIKQEPSSDIENATSTEDEDSDSRPDPDMECIDAGPTPTAVHEVPPQLEIKQEPEGTHSSPGVDSDAELFEGLKVTFADKTSHASRNSRTVPEHEILEVMVGEGSDFEEDVFTELSKVSPADPDQFPPVRYRVSAFGELDSGDDGTESSDEEEDSGENGDDCVIELDDYALSGLHEARCDPVEGRAGGDWQDPDCNDGRVWSRDLSQLQHAPPFAGTPGLNVNLLNHPSALHFYELFMTRTLINRMVKETNDYAEAVIGERVKLGGSIPRRSVFKTWAPITEPNMRKFLAILIHMAIVKKPLISDYWSTNIVVSSNFAAQLMSKSKFKSMLAFFHLNDNKQFITLGQEGHDPLFKIRPLLDEFNVRSKEYYTPTSNLCVSEVVCQCKAGFSAHDQSTERGPRLLMLVEAGSSYIYNLEVAGNRHNVRNAPADVCLRLMQPLKGLGYTVFMDRDYCCVDLCHKMASHNTSVVGSVFSNSSGMPSDLVQQTMDDGQMDYRCDGQVVVIRYKDQRDIHIMTTRHAADMVTVRCGGRETEKPEAVVDYIQNMAGANHTNQIINYLPLHRKSVKWWKSLALYLMTAMLLQAHTLFNKHNSLQKKKLWSLDRFVKSVCNEMADSAGLQTTTGRDSGSVL